MCVCVFVRRGENDSSNITRRKWMEPKGERKRSSNWLKCEHSPQQPHSDLILFSFFFHQKRNGSESGSGGVSLGDGTIFLKEGDGTREGREETFGVHNGTNVCVCARPRGFLSGGGSNDDRNEIAGAYNPIRCQRRHRSISDTNRIWKTVDQIYRLTERHKRIDACLPKTSAIDNLVLVFVVVVVTVVDARVPLTAKMTVDANIKIMLLYCFSS